MEGFHVASGHLQKESARVLRCVQHSRGDPDSRIHCQRLGLLERVTGIGFLLLGQSTLPTVDNRIF
jgi:hypothetical protein